MATRIFEKIDNEERTIMQVLDMLRHDSRQSIAGISSRTKMSIYAVSKKIAELEQGCIMKYSSLVDFEKLGYSLGAFFLIKPCTDEKLDSLLMDFLENSRSINTLSRAADGSIIVEARFGSMVELVDFRHFIEGFSDGFREHEILSDVVKERFLL